MNFKPVLKYLQSYGDEFSRIDLADTEIYQRAVVIPLRDEDEFFVQQCLPSLIEATQAYSKSLAILIINSRVNDEPRLLTAHEKLMSDVGASIHKDFTLVKYSKTLDLLLINCNSEGRRLGEKEGVGRARKIGSDVFLKLYIENKISDPWIYASDADVLFPEDYFSFSQQLKREAPDSVVGNTPFVHFVPPQASPEQELAISNYDSYLRYYVSSLKLAGSPYAHPTVGSTQVIHANAYAAVRGYSNLQAGEDFYIANKLLKFGSAYSPSLGPTLKLSGRFSARVPFGTGTAVTKITNDLKQSKAYEVYDSEIFLELKVFLSALENSAKSANWELFCADLKKQSASWNVFHDLIQQWNLSVQLQKLWSMSHNPAMRLKHLHNYFDAFKTLKFVHFFRDQKFSSRVFEARLFQEAGQ